MATTVDRLETVYSVADHYTAPVRKMAQATSDFGRRVFDVTKLFAAFAVAGVGTAFVKFAVDSATEFDTARRRLEAFTGSAKEAARLTQFIQQLAGPSLFEFKDLAAAGGLLAAYGLNVQKVLPLAEQLASAFGDTGESVSEVARVFGRLKAGDFGEAFERLRDFGISFDDLREKGLKFSKSNEFLGTRLEALAAVSSIIEERFGKISALMRDSPAAKFASLMDSLRQGAAKAGIVILEALVPAVETVSNVINFLSKSGIIEKVTRRFFLLFNMGDVRTGLVRGILYIIAVLKELPMTLTRVRGVFETVFAGISVFIRPVVALLAALGAARMVAGIVAVAKVMLDFAKAVRAVAIAAALATGIKNPAAAAVGTAAGVAAAVGIAVGFDKLIGAVGEQFKGALGGLAPSELTKDVDAMMRDLEKSGQQSDAANLLNQMIQAGREAAFSAMGRDDALNTSMKGVEKNTKATAENTFKAIDLKRFALGGGEIGALGVTPVERFRGQPFRRNVNFNSGAVRDKLASAVVEIVESILDRDDIRGNGGR